MEIITIYGKAGCGKSTKLSEIIKKDRSKYVVLAPTNSAVENIFNICLLRTNESENVNELKRDRFKTIYSYFRIDYNNDIVLGAVEMMETIYIDEFSLIDKFLFKKCLNDMRMKKCRRLILCGDVMQLNAVYKMKQYISFDKVKRWNKLYERIMLKVNEVKHMKIMNQMNLMKNVNQTESVENSNENQNCRQFVSPNVLEHLHLNIFGTKAIRKGTLINLTVNKRSNSEIKQILTNIYSKNISFNYQFVSFFDIPKLILNENYVFIASKYSILQKIYDYIYTTYWCNKNNKLDIITIEQHISYSSGFKNLYLYSGMKIIVCDTDEQKKYINGEELIFTGNIECNKLKCYSESRKEIVYIHKIKEVEMSHSEEFYPICPNFLISIHKSQGRTIENVIFCIDELFDMSMLYTGITRAKNKLMFFSEEKNEIKRVELLIKNAYVDDFKQLDLICNNMN